jgi:hypothetical protein
LKFRSAAAIFILFCGTVCADMAGLTFFMFAGLAAAYLGLKLAESLGSLLLKLVICLIFIHVQRLQPQMGRILAALLASGALIACLNLLFGVLLLYTDQVAPSYSPRFYSGYHDLTYYQDLLYAVYFLVDLSVFWALLRRDLPAARIVALVCAINVLAFIGLYSCAYGYLTTGSWSTWPPRGAECRSGPSDSQFRCITIACNTPNLWGSYPRCNLKDDYNRPEVCDAGKDGAERGSCLLMFAEALNDTGLCERIDGGKSTDRILCFHRLAVQNLKPDLCEKAGSARETCYFELAAAMKNPLLCDKSFPADHMRDLCAENSRAR